MNINDLLKIAVERKASDLHLKVGSHPIVRIDGELIGLSELKRLMQEDTVAMAFSIMNAKQKQRFKEELEIDIAYSVPGLGRFRCNIFQQRGTVGMVLRVIPARIQTVRELMLPTVLEKICEERRGLVLCTGTTGSGKSTSLAAMIDHINTYRNEHIITIEDPIEFLHKDKNCVISQREVGFDTHSFGAALKHVLRQDPDVILIGEMRDLETTAISISAAETGHMVYATLHTNSAATTVDRVIDIFPPHQQAQIRMQLSVTLEGILCQTLIPKAKGGGRVMAMELMPVIPAVRNIIREGKSHQIPNAIMSGSQYGMQSMDMALRNLYQQGLITYEDAVAKSTSAEEFNRLIAG
ncbi:MAG: type IV pilus twitching motility protein PilT [Myxococcales bacterium]|nr:type IV pilus twitching motility protein PilT [Myxococcales bacterium]